jgi:hypothetical protein
MDAGDVPRLSPTELRRRSQCCRDQECKGNISAAGHNIQRRTGTATTYSTAFMFCLLLPVTIGRDEVGNHDLDCVVCALKSESVYVLVHKSCLTRLASKMGK